MCAWIKIVVGDFTNPGFYLNYILFVLLNTFVFFHCGFSDYHFIFFLEKNHIVLILLCLLSTTIKVSLKMLTKIAVSQSM